MSWLLQMSFARSSLHRYMTLFLCLSKSVSDWQFPFAWWQTPISFSIILRFFPTFIDTFCTFIHKAALPFAAHYFMTCNNVKKKHFERQWPRYHILILSVIDKHKTSCFWRRKCNSQTCFLFCFKIIPLKYLWRQWLV